MSYNHKTKMTTNDLAELFETITWAIDRAASSVNDLSIIALETLEFERKENKRLREQIILLEKRKNAE